MDRQKDRLIRQSNKHTDHIASQIFGVGHFDEIVDPGQAQSQTFRTGSLYVRPEGL